MSAYVDTSFLVSLYTPDSKSTQAFTAIERLAPPLSIMPLGELELVNALRLRLFRKELRPLQVLRSYRLFRRDLSGGIVTIEETPDAVYADAKRIASRWSTKLGTRTLDILHVASALALRADRLITFDLRQRRLAEAVGIRTSWD